MQIRLNLFIIVIVWNIVNNVGSLLASDSGVNCEPSSATKVLKTNLMMILGGDEEKFGWQWWWWWWWRWQWWWRGLGIAYWWEWAGPDGNWVEKWEEWPKCGSHSTVWQDQAHSVVWCATIVYTLTQCQCSQVTQATLTVLKLKGDPLQYFLAKLMQLYSFGTNLNLNRLFSPFSLGVLLLLSSFLDSHFPEFRRQFFAFSWFLSPTSTE